MRVLVVLCVTLTLSGCTNMVFSERPLFHRADSHGAPRFRPGVWASSSDDCILDLVRPLQDWPGCASGMVFSEDGPKGIPGEMSFRVVAGDPTVVQQTSEIGVFYGGLSAVEHDDHSRISAFEFWIALCGPPPPPRTTGARRLTGSELTRELLPGLEATDDSCRARTPQAVRQSVAQSRLWRESTSVMRWVRRGIAADRYAGSHYPFRKVEEAPAAPAP